MVNVDPSAWDRQRKAAALTDNGLTQYDLEIIGRPVRIEIPFEDPVKLREIADMLRGFANSIDFTTQRDDIPLRARLVMLKQEASGVNYRIRGMHGKSRKWK